MTYPALPDMRIPYDNDGTVVAFGSTFDGVLGYVSGAHAIIYNGLAVNPPGATESVPLTAPYGGFWLFFPEQREVTAYWEFNAGATHGACSFYQWQGSNDTTNGVDGTWETATSSAATFNSLFDWRSGIKTISFTGPKKVVRILFSAVNDSLLNPQAFHVYGAKGAGQTPDDIVYLDADNADNPFTAPVDFGDMPLGTTAVRHFKVQNASATKTANTINIQCNDADFAISSDGVTYVVTINIASLAAGASSGVLYVRNTSPNPGGRLGPRFARIVTTVGSWT